MTVYQLILMQLIAHLVADFWSQSEKCCIEKENHVISKQHFLHAGVVTIMAYLFSLDWCFWISALIIGFSHLVIDALKSYYILKKKDKEVSIFFIDQLLHVIVLSLVSWLYLKDFNPRYIFQFHLSLRHIAIIAAFLFCAKPANIFIKKIFIFFNLAIPKVDPIENNNPEKDLANAGKIIGVMERFMTLVLILSSQYAAVGLVIAAKSILRFNNPQKNEYVLVGTLLSFGFALLIGVLINHISIWVK